MIVLVYCLLVFVLILLLGFTYMKVLFFTVFLSYGILSLSNFVSQLVSVVSLLVLLLFLSWLFLLLNFTLSLSLFSSPILYIHRSLLHPLDGFHWYLPMALGFHLIHFVNFISFSSLLFLLRFQLYLVLRFIHIW